MLVIGSGAPRLDPAPAHVVAQRSGHLAQRRPRQKNFRTPSTVGPRAKTTRRGFESREPPLQAFDTRCGAADIGRLEGAQIGVRARSGPARSCPAHDAAEPQTPDPSSTSFGRPTRQVEEADLRCGPDRGRRARRITSPGLHQAYSLGTTTARASLARVSARRRSRARHATGRSHGLPHRSAKWGSWPSTPPPPRCSSYAKSCGFRHGRLLSIGVKGPGGRLGARGSAAVGTPIALSDPAR